MSRLRAIQEHAGVATLSRSPSPDIKSAKPFAAGVADERLYQQLMPKWRFLIRRRLISILNAEIPHLSRIQARFENGFLDVYFHLVSLFGTHSSFLVLLPLIYWFGKPILATTLLIILATGVYFSSFLKDLVCVPRPYSPPVKRMTLVGSHALEYGWPSTHSTNSVGVALICAAEFDLPGKTLLSLYALSVVCGRMYHGMHSLSDCLGGCVLALLQFLLLRPLLPLVINYAQSGHASVPLVTVPIILSMISIHPQPVDACPCFEDAVAFMAVVLGILLAIWTASDQLTYPTAAPASASLFSLVALHALRIVVGVCILLLWRIIAKQFLHLTLPTLIRVISPYLTLPRRHYEPSKSYQESYSKEVKTSLQAVPSAVNLPQLSPPTTPGKPLFTRKRSKSEVVEEIVSKLEDEALARARREAAQRKLYDADILTKTIVYAGVGWLAYLMPYFFAFLNWSE